MYQRRQGGAPGSPRARGDCGAGCEWASGVDPGWEAPGCHGPSREWTARVDCGVAGGRESAPDPTPAEEGEEGEEREEGCWPGRGPVRVVAPSPTPFGRPVAALRVDDAGSGRGAARPGPRAKDGGGGLLRPSLSTCALTSTPHSRRREPLVKWTLSLPSPALLRQDEGCGTVARQFPWRAATPGSPPRVSSPRPRIPRRAYPQGLVGPHASHEADEAYLGTPQTTSLRLAPGLP